MNRLNLCNGLYDHPTTCFVVANVICTSLPVRKRPSRNLAAGLQVLLPIDYIGTSGSFRTATSHPHVLLSDID